MFEHNYYAAGLSQGDVFKTSGADKILTVDYADSSYDGHMNYVHCTDGVTRELPSFRQVILVRKGA
ncbi:hypothetical protein ACFVZM_06520 [Streptomyces sioyaensis]|uniref:hypothetical protein n=1 Tax=Streptomyces sioyaensis TaxID=67364 RepID=UPI00369226E0